MPATIADVARRAGVSTATVSRILSGAATSPPGTVARVRAAATDLDYRPSGIARSLKLRRTRTIGLIVTDIENPFFPEMVRAVDEAAGDLGNTILLGNAGGDPQREERYLDLLVERRVDGIIVAVSRFTEHHGAWLARAPVPIVLINSESDDPRVPSIVSDNRQGGRLAAEHLLSLGHSRIGILAGPASHAATAPRLEGIREALSAAGLDPAAVPTVHGDGEVAGGERAAAELRALDPAPTGLLCHNDLTAIGAVRHLLRSGLRVPADVSVVGFDDVAAAAWIHPGLTTITQRKAEMGRWAVDRLVELIQGRPASDPRQVHLPVLLTVRESTAPPPGVGPTAGVSAAGASTD